MRVRRVAALCLLSLAVPAPAAADLANFDLAGRLYTKWLYQNDASQGLLCLGNPFWQENFSGCNGVGSEFELTIKGRVSPSVSAEVRIKSRFGALWQDFWENGQQEYAEANTSGESLGLDHAEYMKLRGYWVRFVPPVPGVRYVLVGSSDLSQFNEWTVGKIRYTDRDNAKGVFVDGRFGEDTTLSWHVGAIALPKLWVGPNWSTGLGDDAVDVPFWSQDWGYATKLQLDPDADWRLTAVASLTNDVELDACDPDAVATLCPDGPRDHAVDRVERYQNAVATLQLDADPTDTLATSALLGWSASRINPAVAANGVEQNAGVYPLVYDNTGGDVPDDLAWRLRGEWTDPLDVGLSLDAEYFYVGQDWTSIMAARREGDVLLTGGFLDADQLPTLNLANEFIDFDDPWVESIIGWHGGTVVGAFESGGLETSLEVTGLTYNTNGQGRDVDHVYPTFQHSQGYTDLDLYDYANETDRGRDPRSVYRENQDRRSFIGALRAEWVFAPRWRVGARLKGVRDDDGRDTSRADDDYTGLMLDGRVWLSAPLASFLTASVGGAVARWDEQGRSGSPNEGYTDYVTDKQKAWLRLAYDHAGVRFFWHLELLGKQQAVSSGTEPAPWRVVRSKGAMEVAW